MIDPMDYMNLPVSVVDLRDSLWNSTSKRIHDRVIDEVWMPGVQLKGSVGDGIQRWVQIHNPVNRIIWVE
jgi:hypothetical protein